MKPKSSGEPFSVIAFIRATAEMFAALGGSLFTIVTVREFLSAREIETSVHEWNIYGVMVGGLVVMSYFRFRDVWTLLDSASPPSWWPGN